MKSISKIAAFVLPVLAALTVGAAPVFADSPGQLGSGPYFYEVKNVTTNGAYASSTSASACDVVKFSTELNNGGYGGLTNIVVKASLPTTSSTSVTSSVTATPSQGATYGASGSAAVNFSSAQSLSYVNGSAKLYDLNGNLLQTMPDTITTSGVTVASLQGSTTEFLNFEAQASGCTTTPTPTTFTATATATASASAKASCPNGSGSATASASASATASATSNVSQADADQQAQTAAQNDANAKAKASATAKAKAEVKCSAPVTTVSKSKPTSLPNTGAGDVVGIFAGTSALGSVGHFFVSRRRK